MGGGRLSRSNQTVNSDARVAGTEPRRSQSSTRRLQASTHVEIAEPLLCLAEIAL